MKTEFLKNLFLVPAGNETVSFKKSVFIDLVAGFFGDGSKLHIMLLGAGEVTKGEGKFFL